MSELSTGELLTAEKLSSVLEERIAQLVPAWLAEKPELRERLTEILADNPQEVLIPSMSYEEFLAWASDGIRAEWVEGKVFLMSPASSRHQLIIMWLGGLLTFYVSNHDLGVVMGGPFQMRLAHPPRGREPDILFIEEAHTERIKKQYLDGPADLAVEVVSPESTRRDRGEKFYEYEIAGVREYWLIDPEREQAEFYQLDEQGHYALILGGHTGQYVSKVIPGFRIDVSWFWQERLPKVWQA